MVAVVLISLGISGCTRPSRAEKWARREVLGAWAVIQAPAQPTSLTSTAIRPRYLCFATNGMLYVRGEAPGEVDSAQYRITAPGNGSSGQAFFVDLYMPAAGTLLHHTVVKATHVANFASHRPKTLRMFVSAPNSPVVADPDSASFGESAGAWAFDTRAPGAHPLPPEQRDTISPNCFD